MTIENTTVTAQLGCKSSPESARDYERGYACGWYDMMARAADIAATMGREDIELKIRAVERRGHAQTPAVPEGYVLVPRELTAENGAKAFLIGEFSETFDYMDDEGDECVADIPVSWTTIKAIHKKMVALFTPSDTSTDRSPIMQAADKAARVVEGWSDAKRDYADRVTDPEGNSK